VVKRVGRLRQRHDHDECEKENEIAVALWPVKDATTVSDRDGQEIVKDKMTRALDDMMTYEKT